MRGKCCCKDGRVVHCGVCEACLFNEPCGYGPTPPRVKVEADR